MSRPTARGGQTLVRLKMRNLLTRAVFDKTFKAGEKFSEPDLVKVKAVSLRRQPRLQLHGPGQLRDGDAHQRHARRRWAFLVDNLPVEILKYNGNPIGMELPQHVELAVTYTEPAVRGDTSSGSVTKAATLETGMEVRVPLFVKEGDRVKVHTETREFAGRA